MSIAAASGWKNSALPGSGDLSENGAQDNEFVRHFNNTLTACVRQVQRR